MNRGIVVMRDITINPNSVLTILSAIRMFYPNIAQAQNCRTLNPLPTSRISLLQVGRCKRRTAGEGQVPKKCCRLNSCRDATGNHDACHLSDSGAPSKC